MNIHWLAIVNVGAATMVMMNGLTIGFVLTNVGALTTVPGNVLLPLDMNTINQMILAAADTITV
jgi:hypothetical protein